MIRPYSEIYQDDILAIWLQTNISAHPYISRQIWKELLPAMKDALPRAKIWMEMGKSYVQGFIGVEAPHHIAGLFVLMENQCNGVGSGLVKFVQEQYPRLTLDVFVRNTGAIAFYTRYGFVTISE